MTVSVAVSTTTNACMALAARHAVRSRSPALAVAVQRVGTVPQQSISQALKSSNDCRGISSSTGGNPARLQTSRYVMTRQSAALLTLTTDLAAFTLTSQSFARPAATVCSPLDLDVGESLVSHRAGIAVSIVGSSVDAPACWSFTASMPKRLAPCCRLSFRRSGVPRATYEDDVRFPSPSFWHMTGTIRRVV